MKIEELYTLKKSETPKELEILHPETGEGTGLFISLIGSHSSAYRNEYQRQVTAISRAKVDDSEKVTPLEAMASCLAAVSVDWRGLENDVESSRDGFIELYKQAPNVADQVTDFVGNLANFMKG